MAEGRVITVGIVGLGRSGWGIHAAALRHMPDRFRVAAVTDPIVERRDQSAGELGARAAESMDDILRDRSIDMVVVASPNKFHAPHAIAALKAGKHVLCEKPFGFTVGDVDAMIAAAQQSGVVLQPFQQRRYEPDFNRIREICRSGLLGRLTFIRLCWHGFKRRWDWQTSRELGGGELYNNAPHPLDHALELFGPAEPQVWCELRHWLSSGGAEDEVRIILSAPDAPTIQIELTCTTAYPQDRWLICGTSGGLRGTGNRLSWRWVDWSKMPPRPLDMRPTPDRSYNSEKLEWHEESWEPSGAVDTGGGAAPARQPVIDLYSDFYRSITEGAPQRITPQAARRRVAVLQKCYELSNIPFPDTAIR
jgi:scyllo-inositol 2-dehydrogenase (NADP+)